MIHHTLRHNKTKQNILHIIYLINLNLNYYKTHDKTNKIKKKTKDLNYVCILNEIILQNSTNLRHRKIIKRNKKIKTNKANWYILS